MKKTILFGVFIALSGIFVFFLAVSVVAVEFDVKKYPACPYCAMNRLQYAHSRMLVVYDDDTSAATCSLHCAAIELALKLDKTPKSILVSDYYGNKLINAEKAFWVVGGRAPGVMTSNAKWAFSSKQDADNFINKNGGVPATFDDAIRAAYYDMYQDTKLIRENRRIKRPVKINK